MGQDKASLLFQGKPLFHHSLRLVSHFAEDVWIIGLPGRPELETLGIRVMADLVSPKGPISGIVTALRSTPSLLNLVVACDMPRIPTTFVDLLFERANGADAVVFISNSGQIEPLCALYSKKCLPIFDLNFRLEKYKISDSLEQLRVNHISEEDLWSRGLQAGIFRSINTPGDFAEFLDESSG
jgi:molybdopterin-guanine dinucleotide biosynthesis protein A